MQNILENLSCKLEMSGMDVHSLAVTVETEIRVSDQLINFCSQVLRGLFVLSTVKRILFVPFIVRKD